MTFATVIDEIDQPPTSAEAHPISLSDIEQLSAIAHSAEHLTRTPTPIAASEVIDRRWVMAAMSIAAVSFLLLHIADMNFCDPDMWHEMSLFRQSLAEGWVPTEDRFAYTPTVSPSVHHEWGAGAIFYAVATAFGGPGVMVFKYALVAFVVGICFECARRRGTSVAVFCTVAPAMALFSSYGFTTIRAQVFTLAMLAVMLCLLELDQLGRRKWIAAWLPLHVLWLNLHAGFVVGAGLMAIHACEQIVRRRPFRHFVPVGLALAALIFVNPYGTLYLPYLMHGLTMARPLIVEWNPLWQHDARVFSLYLISLIPIGYAIRQLGFKRITGLVILAATAYAALRHTRHLSLYCVVWTCYVPGYLQQTKVGPLIEQFVTKYGRLVTYICIAITLGCASRIVAVEPWKLMIPSTNLAAEQGLVCYPIGAVQYLKDEQFHGNVMVPFEVGGYTMWKLHPAAKVSIDGRYEVAYQPGVLEEHLKLYQVKAGWREVLEKYPTDAIVIPSLSRLSAAMPTTTWKRTYRDGVYEVYTRPGFFLPAKSNATADVRGSLP